MKLSSLRAFVAIAKYQSFTKASESLFISQPTLSRTVMELEEELGVKLFNREKKKKLTLTEEGEVVFREASDILERCDRLAGKFKSEEERQAEQSVITVGYQTSLNIQRVYPMFERFMRENSGCRVLIEEARPDALKEGLLNRKYDFVIAMDSSLLRPIDPDATQAYPIGESRLQVAVPENSPFAAEEAVGLMELKKEPFILINRRYAPETVDRLIARCVMNGFSPKADDYVDSLQQALENVSMGKGISFVHSAMKTDWMESHFHVRILDLKDDVYRTDVLLIRPSGTTGRQVEKLIGLMKQMHEDPHS